MYTGDQRDGATIMVWCALRDVQITFAFRLSSGAHTSPLGGGRRSEEERASSGTEGRRTDQYGSVIEPPVSAQRSTQRSAAVSTAVASAAGEMSTVRTGQSEASTGSSGGGGGRGSLGRQTFANVIQRALGRGRGSTGIQEDTITRGLPSISDEEVSCVSHVSESSAGGDRGSLRTLSLPQQRASVAGGAAVPADAAAARRSRSDPSTMEEEAAARHSSAQGAGRARKPGGGHGISSGQGGYPILRSHGKVAWEVLAYSHLMPPAAVAA